MAEADSQSAVTEGAAEMKPSTAAENGVTPEAALAVTKVELRGRGALLLVRRRSVVRMMATTRHMLQ